MITSLVADLPEVYQPIHGHPNLSGQVSRTCQDRLEHIARIHDAIQRLLGRPLKVLDLGCAQGYFSLNLAERGSTVHGVDYLDKNVAVCNALARENSTLRVSFETGRIEDVIARLEPGQYDLVLGLSVFHHIVHEKGVATVQDLLARAASQCGALVLELALREEPLYWGPAQPEDPRWLLKPISFVHNVASHATHLAQIPRPLFVASNHYWIFQHQAGRFEEWSTDPHSLAKNTHEGSRRYYFGVDTVVKMYRVDNAGRGDHNRMEFEREISFLQAPPKKFHAPALLTHGINETEAWVVMQRLSGRLLLDVLREGRITDTNHVLLAVLEQLVSLEAANLYHDDVRTWNILIAEDGAVHLIDYGSISPVAQDCVWPGNLFFAFFIFVREVITGKVDDPDPLRTIAINPLRLPPRYQAWAKALWHRPLTEWSFRLMHQTLLNGVDNSNSYPSPNNPQEVWMLAIEDAIQAQKNFSQHISAGLRVTHAAQTKLKELGETAVTSAQQAIASADSASSIAQQAMVASQQTRDLIAGFESTLLHYQSLATASEQRMNALLNSTSWRITAPLRGLRTILASLLKLPLRLLRVYIRPIILAIMRFVIARPRLANRLAALLRDYPWLHSRLRLFAIHRGVIEQAESQPLSTSAQAVEVPPGVTPHAHRIFDQLKTAIKSDRLRE